jgi:hypothetical protein
MIPGWDRKTAPAILVPKEGHTSYNSLNQRLSTNTGPNAPSTPRGVLARDIRELRRVYPDIPNSSLQQLIQLNKSQYPGHF